MGMKGHRCNCCTHRERAAIDLALARGVSTYALEKRYGVSHDSLGRHARHHLPPQLRAKLMHKNLELVGKLLGTLGIGSTTVNNNVLIMPAYIELRIGLVEALAPFPEAKVAVAQVLHRLEDRAAQSVAAKSRSLAQ